MLNWRKDKGTDSGADAAQPAPATAAQERYPSASELGEMLVEAGLIDAGQFGEALAKAEGDGIFIGQVLVESGSVDRKQLTSFIVKECRIPHLSLVDYEINQDLLELIPKDACLQHRVLPIDKLGRILTLAMVNPLDADALAEMRALCPQLKVKPILCDWEDYDQVATRLFASSKGGGSEISMSSFGLTESTAETGEPSAETPKPSATVGAPVAATDAVTAPPPSRDAPAPSGDWGALAAALRDGLRESSQETVAALKAALAERPAAHASHSGPTLESAIVAIEASVTQALKDSFSGLTEELRAMRQVPVSTGETGGGAPAPVMQGPSAAELAEAMRESMKGVMDEAMRPLLDRLGDPTPAPAGGADPQAQGDGGADSAALLAGVQETLREQLTELANTMRQASAGDDAPVQGLEGVANEIRESAEAVMEAVRAAVSVQKDSVEALSSDFASKVKRFNTVQPFRGAGGDKALEDALDAVVIPEDERVRQALDASAPLAGFSFDSFMVSKENAFTVNVAQQIAAEPGGEHNPFFVFGPVGIGKTHLINAVGNAIQQADESRRVGYASAGRFAGKALEALHEHAAAAFREAYCHWDVLILDDIQFLGGHVEAQEEFFHIFNALQQEGRQIIIAADQAPDQLGQLERRLVSRFAGGMVTPLDPPDYETRVSILKQLAQQGKAKVPEDVLAVVATRVPRDVRKMVGAMRKIIAFTGLVGQDVSCETAYEILNKMGVAEAVAS
jgi:chromosomal replication initiator protein DnaA